MTYGHMLAATRQYVETRAVGENIELEKLGLEPEWQECHSCIDSDTCLDGECEDGSIRPRFLREIAITYNGCLDETFYLDDLYAVNVADWLAEQCRELAEATDDYSWEIVVTIPHPDDSTEIYKVSSEDEFND
jgi:hypothetical protein